MKKNIFTQKKAARGICKKNKKISLWQVVAGMIVVFRYLAINT